MVSRLDKGVHDWLVVPLSSKTGYCIIASLVDGGSIAMMENQEPNGDLQLFETLEEALTTANILSEEYGGTDICLRVNPVNEFLPMLRSEYSDKMVNISLQGK